MSNFVENERTWKSLVETSPNNGDFLSKVLLEAHDVVGTFAKENELPIARAVVYAFYDKGILGNDIGRLREFVEGSAKKAYDVLTDPGKLLEFRSVCPVQK